MSLLLHIIERNRLLKYLKSRLFEPASQNVFCSVMIGAHFTLPALRGTARAVGTDQQITISVQKFVDHLIVWVCVNLKNILKKRTEPCPSCTLTILPEQSYLSKPGNNSMILLLFYLFNTSYRLWKQNCWRYALPLTVSEIYNRSLFHYKISKIEIFHYVLEIFFMWKGNF